MAALVLVVACGPGEPVGVAETGATQAVVTTGPGEPTTAGDSSTGAPGATPASVPDSEGEATTGSAATTAPADTESMPTFMPTPCETWNDECPAGQHCIPYGDLGAPYPDRHGCFPIVAEPLPVGETCTPLVIQRETVVTLDPCERGLVCSWRTGTCLALCQGSLDALTCPMLSACTGWEYEPLCWPICDPLAPTCPPGARCNLFTTVGFQCYPAGPDDVPLFSPCSQGDECGVGTFCDVAAAAVECDAAREGCCNKLCDLDGDTCPGVGQTCVPFDYYVPLPEYADLGRCAAP